VKENTICTGLEIAAIVAATASAASAGVGISQATRGTPKLPKPPAPPPPAPPPPTAPPPFAPETDEETPVAERKKKRDRGYTLTDTLLTSPLGEQGGVGTKTLLGG
jgi:hypothetical protein